MQGQLDENELRDEMVRKIADIIRPVLLKSTVDRNEVLPLVPEIDDIVKSAYNFVKDIEQFTDRPQSVPGWILNGWSGPEDADHPTKMYSTLPNLHLQEQINYLNTEAAILLSLQLEPEGQDIAEEIFRTIQERVRLLELLENKEHRAHLANLLLSLYREIAGVLISKVNSPVFQSLKEHHNEIRFSFVFETFLEDVGDALLTTAHAWAQSVSGPLEWGLAETGPAPIYTMLPGSDRVWRAAEKEGISMWVPDPNWDPAGGQDDSGQWQSWYSRPTETKQDSKEETILRIISPHLEGDFTLGQYTDLLPTVLDLIRNLQNPKTVQLLAVPTAFNFIELSENYAEQGDMNRSDKVMAFVDLPQRALFIMDLKQLCLDLLSIIQNEQGNLAEQMIADGTIQPITPEQITELRKTYERYNEIAYEWANSMLPSPVASPNKAHREAAPPPFDEHMDTDTRNIDMDIDEDIYEDIDQTSAVDLTLQQRPGAPPPFEEDAPYDPGDAPYDAPGGAIWSTTYVSPSEVYAPYSPHSPGYVPPTSFGSDYVPHTSFGPDDAYQPGDAPDTPISPDAAPHSPVNIPIGQWDVEEEGEGSEYESFGVIRSSPTPPPESPAQMSRSGSRSPKPAPKSNEFVIDFDSDSDSD